MNWRGIEYRYTIWRGGELLVAGEAFNLTALEGEELFLRVLWQKSMDPLRYYLGLTSANLSALSVAGSVVAGEPLTGAGYARIALHRNSSDFPTIETVLLQGQSHKQARSRQVTFRNTSDPDSGGQPWPIVNKLFLVARITDSPVSERLISFASLGEGSVALMPKASIVVEARPLYGNLAGGGA